MYKDHVHLSVAIPQKLSISNFMGYLKGKSTLMLYDRHPELQSKWDKAFWARGYYVETIGNITDEAVLSIPGHFLNITVRRVLPQLSVFPASHIS